MTPKQSGFGQVQRDWEKTHRKNEDKLTQRRIALGLNTQEGSQAEVKLPGAISKVVRDEDRKCSSKPWTLEERTYNLKQEQTKTPNSDSISK